MTKRKDNPARWSSGVRVHAASKVSEDERKRLQAEIPPDTRSVTGQLMGDPLPTRSALDLELRQ